VRIGGLSPFPGYATGVCSKPGTTNVVGVNNPSGAVFGVLQECLLGVFAVREWGSGAGDRLSNGFPGLKDQAG